MGMVFQYVLARLNDCLSCAAPHMVLVLVTSILSKVMLLTVRFFLIMLTHLLCNVLKYLLRMLCIHDCVCVCVCMCVYVYVCVYVCVCASHPLNH